MSAETASGTFAASFVPRTVALSAARYENARGSDEPSVESFEAAVCVVDIAGFTLTGHEMAELCQQALGRPVRAARISWLPIQLMSPVWAMGRRLIEMRYLWSKPHHLDGSRLAELLPQFRATPMEEAIASALQPNIHPDKPVARPLSGVAAE